MLPILSLIRDEELVFYRLWPMGIVTNNMGPVGWFLFFFFIIFKKEIEGTRFCGRVCRMQLGFLKISKVPPGQLAGKHSFCTSRAGWRVSFAMISNYGWD